MVKQKATIGFLLIFYIIKMLLRLSRNTSRGENIKFIYSYCHPYGQLRKIVVIQRALEGQGGFL